MGSPMVAPYGAYPTADQQTAVFGTTSDRAWRRLARDLLDRPDLARDPRRSLAESGRTERLQGAAVPSDGGPNRFADHDLTDAVPFQVAR